MSGGDKAPRKKHTIAAMRVVFGICSTPLPTTSAFSALCTASELFLLLSHLLLPTTALLPPTTYYCSPTFYYLLLLSQRTGVCLTSP